MTRDEMASEYAKFKDPFNKGLEGICPITRQHFQSGWDAALKYDDRMSALLEAIECIVKHGDHPIKDGVWAHYAWSTANEALKKWRGEI